VYDYVFAADGAKSTVRKKLAIPFEGDTFKPEMYLSDY
jgi:2-polyprenyl-6-methoxyphenol hydroxylase-like FAD-dependent oxidoreductase